MLKVGAGSEDKIRRAHRGSREDKIRRAYRGQDPPCGREALRWHPDKNPGDTEAATVSFQQVQTAFVALQENDAESCKENLREGLRRGMQKRGYVPGELRRKFAEMDARTAALISADKEKREAESEAFHEAFEATLPLHPNWKRVPSVTRPGKISYRHLRTGVKQTAFPMQEPTAEQIAQHKSIKRAAAALASGRPQAAARAAPASAGLASTARWPKWRWLGRRDRADPEQVRL